MALGLTQLPLCDWLLSAKEQHANKTFRKNKSVHKDTITMFVVANNTYSAGSVITLQ